MKICRFCMAGNRIGGLTDDTHFEIKGKQLTVVGKVLNILFSRDCKINYCPMCGRKLGD